jgi:hypothetical protein
MHCNAGRALWSPLRSGRPTRQPLAGAQAPGAAFEQGKVGDLLACRGR